jgi:hypothetical protein
LLPPAPGGDVGPVGDQVEMPRIAGAARMAASPGILVHCKRMTAYGC